MTREEYNTIKRDYRVFGWVLLVQFLFAFGVWVAIIHNLNQNK